MKKKGMIAVLAVLMILSSTSSAAVHAEDLSAEEVQKVSDQICKSSSDKVYNHLIYSVSYDGTITIQGIDNANENANIELVIPAEINGCKVTTIASSAFSGCVNIKSVTLNDGLVTIGNWAFDGTSISVVDIPATVTTIGEYAFSSCLNLTKVTFQEGLKTIGNYAFTKCSLLTGNIVIPSTATEIGIDAFSGTAITGLKIEEGALGIKLDGRAFTDCANLSELELNRVTVMDYMCFKNDMAITNVTLPQGLQIIGTQAFLGANNLGGNLIVPSTVTSIGDEAFKGTSIEGLTVEEGNEGITIGYDTFRECANLKYANLSNRLKQIGYDAFWGDSKLVWVRIADGNYPLEICGSAFYGAKHLKAISLPTKLTKIGNWTFYDCSELKDVYYASSQENYNTYVTVANGHNDPYFNATLHFNSQGPDEWPSTVYTGWMIIDGKDYWYENDVLQGYDPNNADYRGKEIYDPDSDAWYWLDNVQQGAKAVSKDVYQESEAGQWADREDGTGKWVRYDADGHMVKGWQTTDQGTYYFDPVYGTMAKGTATIDGMTYYFDTNTGILQSTSPVENGWWSDGGQAYWYENGVRQGYDPNNADYRGKEIYDPDSDAWYWLDNVQQGAKAVSKDVYQESEAGQWADREDGTGKWVRYDADGHMVKGWQTTDQGTYYFDPVYGTMAKGNAVIDGATYYFDVTTGILQ